MTMRFADTSKSPYIRLHRLCIMLLLLSFFPPHMVSADIGPKPTMSFAFMWETEDQPSIVEGHLLQCKDAECVESYPLETLGPQHFTCSDVACDSMAYGYTSYAKLVLSFSDGVTRESNIFGKVTYNSQFEVTVRSSDLVVTETGRTNMPFASLDPINALVKWVEVLFGLGILVVLFALSILMIVKTRQAPLVYANAKITCISLWIITLPALILGTVFAPTLPLTLVIEGALISLYTLIKKHRWFPWVTVVTLGNLLTQVMLLTALVVVGDHGMPLLFTLILEIGIWLLEATLIHLALRRQKSIVTSLGISLILNAVSMGIGLLLSM